MAKCPKCGEETSKPEKSFSNSHFYVEAYTCPNCGANFKVTG